MAATHTAELTQHATLSTTTIDSVTLTGPCTRVRIYNGAAAGTDLWVTISNVTGTLPADPVSGADGTYRIAGVSSRYFYGRRGMSVKLLGSANPYSVEGETLGEP
jgi:hypothetical protein